MSEHPLPARPSLEQLQKQAKELLRAYRAGDPAAVERFRKANPPRTPEPSLSGAQFTIARERGFETWAQLKRHIEAVRPSGIGPYERLAKDLAAAYASGNAMAIREINWNLGTAFVWDHDPVAMQRRLPSWFAAAERTDDLALADAQRMVAASYGFENWSQFARSLAAGTPEFYSIDRKENVLSVRGPMTASQWDAVCGVMQERGITGLHSGGMTDDGLERVSRLNHVTRLGLDNSNLLTDEGLRFLARMPQLQDLDLSGYKGVITDRGLEALRRLTELRRFQMAWQQNVSDAGIANLAACERLESVNLMGTPAGDGAIRAMAGKPQLTKFKTGRLVTDAGLPLLHQFPAFRAWQGGEPEIGLMSFDSGSTDLMLDGPFTDAGLAALAGLEGLSGVSFFWHCPALTAAGIAQLRDLPNLGFLGIDGKRCDDDAMRSIAAIPRLRMLMAQGTVATDEGFAALSRSRTVEYLWGRECPNLTGRGFAALAAMPALRGVAVSCKSVDDASLSLLPGFPVLTDFLAMDVRDDGFRHVGRCEGLERLWCMYCRDTGDAATEHLAGLARLQSYYAGQTKITDRSLEILSGMESLERLEFWSCAGLTNAGIAHLVRLPRLREVSLDGLPNVTRGVLALFPAGVRVSYSG